MKRRSRWGKHVGARVSAMALAVALFFGSFSGSMPGVVAFAQEDVTLEELAASDAVLDLQEDAETVTVTGTIILDGVEDDYLEEFSDSFSVLFAPSNNSKAKREAVLSPDGSYSVEMLSAGDYEVYLCLNHKKIQYITTMEFNQQTNELSVETDVLEGTVRTYFEIEGVDPSEVKDILCSFPYSWSAASNYDHGTQYDFYSYIDYSLDDLLAGKVRLFDYSYKAEIGRLPENIVYESYETKNVIVSRLPIKNGKPTYTISFKRKEIPEIVPFSDTLTVGKGKDFETINGAVDAIRRMDRDESQRVTVLIDPGDYQEMVRVDVPNVTFRNAVSNGSITPTNKGVSIEADSVRITGYYVEGFSYYSMGRDGRYNPDLVEIAKYNNEPCYPVDTWYGEPLFDYDEISTVVIAAPGFEAYDIIFENSWSQYISEARANDVVEDTFGSMTREQMEYLQGLEAGDTSVQDHEYWQVASAIGILKKAYFNHCSFISHAGAIYLKDPSAFYGCDIYGAGYFGFSYSNPTVFAKCNLIFNNNDDNSDIADIRYFYKSLMYNCHIKSAVPGVDTASENYVRPGYLGSVDEELVYYYTVIDEVNGKSLILPSGWYEDDRTGAHAGVEYGTIELSGEDNSSKRLIKVSDEPKTVDGKDITVSAFLGDWDPFAEHGDDMTISIPHEDKPDNEIVNVRDYGAVGDGVTDDTESIKKALVAANGKTLYVPAGRYSVSYVNVSGITANMYSDGDAWFCKNDTATKPIFQFSNCPKGDIKGIGFDEGTAAFEASVESACLYFDDSGNIKVSECQFTNCAAKAIAFFGETRRINICNNSFKNASGLIWVGKGTVRNAYFVNNVAYDGKKDAIVFTEPGKAKDSFDIEIRNNEFHNFKNGSAVQLRGVSDVTIENNFAENCEYFLMAPRPYQKNYEEPQVIDVTVTGNRGNVDCFTYLYAYAENPKALYSGISFANNDFTAANGVTINACNGISFAGDRLHMPVSASLRFNNSEDIKLSGISLDSNKSAKPLLKFDACDDILLKDMNMSADRVPMQITNSDNASVNLENVKADFSKCDKALQYSLGLEVLTKKCTNTGKTINANMADEQTVIIPIIGDEFVLESDEDVHISTVLGYREKYRDGIILRCDTNDIILEPGGNIYVDESFRYSKGEKVWLSLTEYGWSQE